MNVSRITQLFSVPGGVSGAQNQRPGSIDSGSPSPTTNNAVKLSPDSDPATRAAKVADIKAAVQNGSYDYNRQGVATAIVRDLL